MAEIETAIRLIVIGQELLIAAILLFGRGSRAARYSGALLLLSVAGYLYSSDPVLRESLPELLPLIVLLAIIPPYCLWSFARAIFEAAWPPAWVMAGFASVGVAVWVIFLARDRLGIAWVDGADVVMHIVALVLVFHTVWMTVRGRLDDLIEFRRQLRLWFVILVAAQATAVLVVELVFGNTEPPGWLTMLNVMIIALLTLGLAIPMLRANPEFIPAETPRNPASAARNNASLGAADAVLRDRLIAAMDEGVYRETGLTIRMLADKLDYPEHQLRRLINGHLGFRNFSAFLNSYRIKEAGEQLADRERARIPVLTIALDLGYASLGPFNRAFKEATGMTPTDYRRQELST